MDLTNTTIPDSTQWNAEDFLGGPRTFEVADVTAGSSEQPVNVHLVGSDRVYRPSKSMRRVLIAAWGPEASNYTGRRLTLYRDPEVTFGKDRCGGIKISHLSHIDKPLSIALTVTRGKRKPHAVTPLLSTPALPPLTEAMIACADDAQLREWWAKYPEQQDAIKARAAELKAGE